MSDSPLLAGALREQNMKPGCRTSVHSHKGPSGFRPPHATAGSFRYAKPRLRRQRPTIAAGRQWKPVV